jgi:type II secretory pathway pseudopilin PulG
VKLGSRGGFTLVEAIVVVLVTALVGSILGFTFVNLGRDWDAVQTRKAIERDVWGALERMRRDVQRLRSCTLEDVLTFAATDFRFRDASAATIRYQLVGAQLQRNGVTILDGVSAFTTSYWTATATAATRVGDIRRVVVTIEATRNGEKVTLHSEITPRSATFPFGAWSES